MPQDIHKSGGDVLIAPLPVRAVQAEMNEFGAALGLPPGIIPLTFPIRWLALPSVRQAIEDLIGANPVHASQTFEFGAGVAADRDYALRVSIRPDGTPVRRIVVRSTVTDQHERMIVRFESTLLPTSAIARASAPTTFEAGAGSLPDIAAGPVDQAQAARYAAAAHDDSRLHADLEFARSVGLDRPIIHGMLMMGLFQKALKEWPVGSNVTRLFALFTRPVPIDSRLVIGGRIVAPAKAHGADRQIVRLFVRTENNEVACIGEAMLAPPQSVPL